MQMGACRFSVSWVLELPGLQVLSAGFPLRRQKAIGNASPQERETFAEALLPHAMDLYMSPHGGWATPRHRASSGDTAAPPRAVLLRTCSWSNVVGAWRFQKVQDCQDTLNLLGMGFLCELSCLKHNQAQHSK